MKKIIIILGIILTSGIAALALSSNKNNDAKTAQVKTEAGQTNGNNFGTSKNDIANAD
jgi:uncharacterized protein YxeA